MQKQLFHNYTPNNQLPQNMGIQKVPKHKNGFDRQTFTTSIATPVRMRRVRQGSARDTQQLNAGAK